MAVTPSDPVIAEIEDSAPSRPAVVVVCTNGASVLRGIEICDTTTGSMTKNEENTILYATPELGDKVMKYSEHHSEVLPKHITDYHVTITAARSDSVMLTSNFQSQMHLFLAKMLGAKRVLEIGLYVGYSAMLWSHAVGPDGHVTGLELDPEFAEIAKEAFASQNIHNVEVIVGDASETLTTLEPNNSPYDLVFIDADKPGYCKYLSQLLRRSQPGSSNRLLRPGALIIADNVLRWGHVADDTLKTTYWLSNEDRENELEALRAFNEQCVAESRLHSFLVPLWDGVNLLKLLD